MISNFPKVFYLDEMEMPDRLRKGIRKRRRGYTDRIIEGYEEKERK